MSKTPPRKKTQRPSKHAAPGFQRKFWIGLCVVSSAWMFFFGLMVGRGLVPSQFDIPKLERQLADLAQPVNQLEGTAGQKVIPQPDIPAPELFEALKAPDPVLDLPEEKPGDALAQGPIQTKRTPTGLKKKKSRQTITASKPLTEAPKPPTPVTKERLVVQAAAYKDLDAANEAVATLQQLGHRAYVASVEIEGKGIWHRVRLGPYGTRADADRTVQRLKEKKIDGYIIQ